MVERGEYLALALKQALLELGIQAAAQQLDRGLLAEIRTDTLAEEHRRHAAAAERAHEAEVADLLADQSVGCDFVGGKARGVLAGRRIEKAAAIIGGKQALQRGALRRAVRMRIEKGLAFRASRSTARSNRSRSALLRRVAGLAGGVAHGAMAPEGLAAASAELIVQERARKAPVAIDRAPGQVERLGDLFEGQSGEVAQFDDLGRARVGLRQVLERFVERERLLGTGDRDRVAAGERDLHPAAAGALAQAVARAVAQQVAHRACGIGKELRRMGEREFAVRADAQIQFVDERGRVQRCTCASLASWRPAIALSRA